VLVPLLRGLRHGGPHPRRHRRRGPPPPLVEQHRRGAAGGGEGLRDGIDGRAGLVITTGTTAFPSSKWKDGNNPKVACLDSVVDALEAVKACKNPPRRVVLISSIGVERRASFPFLILNAFGVLDAKVEAEQALQRYANELGFDWLIVRPGRLVGAPFTNLDVAKLLQAQAAARGVDLSSNDDIAGDVDREDVARLVVAALRGPGNLGAVTIVNAPGGELKEEEWAARLSALAQ